MLCAMLCAMCVRVRESAHACCYGQYVSHAGCADSRRVWFVFAAATFFVCCFSLQVAASKIPDDIPALLKLVDKNLLFLTPQHVRTRAHLE